jgi:hypothetical protein
LARFGYIALRIATSNPSVRIGIAVSPQYSERASRPTAALKVLTPGRHLASHRSTNVEVGVYQIVSIQILANYTLECIFLIIYRLEC